MGKRRTAGGPASLAPLRPAALPREESQPGGPAPCGGGCGPGFPSALLHTRSTRKAEPAGPLRPQTGKKGFGGQGACPPSPRPSRSPAHRGLPWSRLAV